MGFSVSGATVVVFLGMVISFGIAYSAASDGFERVTDAYGDSADDELARKNTAIEITGSSVANEDGELVLHVDVTNEGTTALDVEDTDVLVDGVYRTHDTMGTLAVDGDPETDLWLPGETLHFEVAVSTTEPQVTVVAEPGVSALVVV